MELLSVNEELNRVFQTYDQLQEACLTGGPNPASFGGAGGAGGDAISNFMVPTATDAYDDDGDGDLTPYNAGGGGGGAGGMDLLNLNPPQTVVNAGLVSSGTAPAAVPVLAPPSSGGNNPFANTTATAPAVTAINVAVTNSVAPVAPAANNGGSATTDLLGIFGGPAATTTSPAPPNNTGGNLLFGNGGGGAAPMVSATPATTTVAPAVTAAAPAATGGGSNLTDDDFFSSLAGPTNPQTSLAGAPMLGGGAPAVVSANTNEIDDFDAFLSERLG